jgi:hypothetical protein
MDEEEGRKTMEAIVFLDGFYFSFTKITKIVTNYLRLDQLVKAIFQIILILDFN